MNPARSRHCDRRASPDRPLPRDGWEGRDEHRPESQETHAVASSTDHRGGSPRREGRRRMPATPRGPMTDSTGPTTDSTGPMTAPTGPTTDDERPATATGPVPCRIVVCRDCCSRSPKVTGVDHAGRDILVVGKGTPIQSGRPLGARLVQARRPRRGSWVSVIGITAGYAAAVYRHWAAATGAAAEGEPFVVRVPRSVRPTT